MDTIKTRKKTVVEFESGVLGIASDLVKYDSKIQKTVEFVLGRLLIVDNIDTGLKILKSNKYSLNIATLDGQYLSSSGRITGGGSLKSTASVIFDRRKEIRNLEEKIHIKTKDNNILLENIRNFNKKLEEYESNIQQNEKKKEKIKLDAEGIKEEHNTTQLDNIKVEKTLSVNKYEIDELNENLMEYTSVLNQATIKIKQTDEDLDNILFDLETFKSRYQLKENEIEDFEQSNSDKQIEQFEKIEQIKQLKINIENIEIEIKDLTLEFQEYKNRYFNCETNKKDLDEKLDNLGKKYTKESSKLETDENTLNDNKNRLKEYEKKEKELILIIKNIEKDLLQSENNYNNLKEKHEKILGRVENTIEKLEELKDIKHEKLSIDFDIAKKNLFDKEVMLKSMGNINLLAIEEYEELKVRYNFLLEQKNDLITSRKKLLNLIKEVEENIVSNFLSAYKNINNNFNYMCKEILNNSIGRLKLLDDENLLETGVELVVKFANKKSQTLSLLSGGEKSMVAVALIMAIFMYKPSPFTFFDEIEAALDDANTKRLINKLKEFTDKSQFILITHNKQTMKESDILYGVTMDKKIGESKILSVKL